MEEITLKLPSGREVKHKKPGMVEYLRITGAMPNLLNTEVDAKGKVKKKEARTIGELLKEMPGIMQAICECSTTPRFYYDDRTYRERISESLPVAQGMVEIDLAPDDCVAYFESIMNELQGFGDTAEGKSAGAASN